MFKLPTYLDVEVRRRQLRRQLEQVREVCQQWGPSLLAIGDIWETDQGAYVDVYLREDLPETGDLILRRLTEAELDVLILVGFVGLEELQDIAKRRSYAILRVEWPEWMMQ